MYIVKLFLHIITRKLTLTTSSVTLPQATNNSEIDISTADNDSMSGILDSGLVKTG